MAVAEKGLVESFSGSDSMSDWHFDLALRQEGSRFACNCFRIYWLGAG